MRSTKLALLGLARKAGIFSATMASSWRCNRLLILCFHGISLDDEHQWEPGLYISPQQFERRLEALRESGCNVLPLGEALERLRTGTLCQRAVTITFDDGFYDFSHLAWPLLKRFSFPASVYLTTYYSDHSDWPVFDPMVSYVLWKSSGKALDWPEVLGSEIHLEKPGREKAQNKIKSYSLQNGLSGDQKHELLGELCKRTGFDLENAVRRRILCLMSQEEVRKVATEGADIQLHTHRHLLLPELEILQEEIEDNRLRIEQLTQRPATHFSYPRGRTLVALPKWLRAAGVLSATTCELGLAARTCNPYYYPRVLDRATLTDIEFEAWLCGVSDLIPKRKFEPVGADASSGRKLKGRPESTHTIGAAADAADAPTESPKPPAKSSNTAVQM
jgi:peptidoglycan/xylan/chitin deacetylase (PgdA/CDA1 family)